MTIDPLKKFRWCWEIWTDRHQSITLFNQESSMVIHRRNQGNALTFLFLSLRPIHVDCANFSLIMIAFGSSVAAEKTNLLAYWLTRTRAQLAQNSLLAHFSDRHRRSVIYSVWERWTDRTRARQLEPLVRFSLLLNSLPISYCFSEDRRSIFFSFKTKRYKYLILF